MYYPLRESANVKLGGLALPGELRSRTAKKLIGPEKAGGSKVIALIFWLLMVVPRREDVDVVGEELGDYRIAESDQGLTSC